MDTAQCMHVFTRGDCGVQVDVNGDGSMEWEEFTAFCIEAGMAQGMFRDALGMTWVEADGCVRAFVPVCVRVFCVCVLAWLFLRLERACLRLFVCLFACLFVCLFVCLCVCVFACECVCV
jgi:hypothetical protein